MNMHRNQDVWSDMCDLEAGRIPEPEDSDKRKGWMVNGTFLDFQVPVTQDAAIAFCNMLKKKIEAGAMTHHNRSREG